MPASSDSPSPGSSPVRAARPARPRGRSGWGDPGRGLPRPRRRGPSRPGPLVPAASHCGPRHYSPNSNRSRASLRAGASQEPPPRQGTHPGRPRPRAPDPACTMRASATRSTPPRTVRARRDGIHPHSIRAIPPRTMPAQVTPPKRLPQGAQRSAAPSAARAWCDSPQGRGSAEKVLQQGRAGQTTPPVAGLRRRTVRPTRPRTTIPP